MFKKPLWQTVWTQIRLLLVCSGSTLFASILNSSVMLGNYLQQTTSADDIFRCIFFLALQGLILYKHILNIFQNTPDHNPILDVNPAWKNIAIAAGFSGMKDCILICQLITQNQQSSSDKLFVDFM